MNIIIDNIDFWDDFNCMKYWSPPKTYDRKKWNQELKHLIHSGAYMGSIKVDGIWSMIIKDNNGAFHLRSRTKNVQGTYADKAEWIPSIIKDLDRIPNGTVLLGEIYKYGDEGSRKATSILNCLKDKSLERQATTPLHFYCFDVLAYKNKSLIDIPIETRINRYLNHELNDVLKGDSIEVAKYYVGEELWDKIGESLANGREGMVVQKLSAPYTCNKRTAKLTIKIKKEIANTIDVFLTGNYKLPVREYRGKTPLESYLYWENVKTGEIFSTNKYKEYIQGVPVEPISRHYALKYAGSVEIAVMKDGIVTPVGYISGITDDVRKGIVLNPEAYRGRVYELSCMEIEKTGISETGYSFRHPKFIGERTDGKKPEDCDFSQISG